MCHTKERVKHAGCKGTGDVISYPSASPASSWEHELRGDLRSMEEAHMGNLIAQYGQEWFSMYKGQFHGHLPWRAGGIWKLNCYLCVWKPLLQCLDRMVTGFYKNPPKQAPVFLLARVSLLTALQKPSMQSPFLLQLFSLSIDFITCRNLIYLHNQRISCVGRDSQGSLRPSLKGMAHTGIKHTTSVLSALCSDQLSSSQGQTVNISPFLLEWMLKRSWGGL